jgi:hypothetical protein
MGFGIIAGIVWMLVKLGGMTGVRPPWVYRWFRLVGNERKSRFIDRVRAALSPDIRFNDLRLLWPLIVPIILWLLVAATSLDAGIMEVLGGFVISYAGAAGLAMGLGVLKRSREQTALYAAQQAARQLPVNHAEEILLPLAGAQQTGLRLAAVEGLRELGTPRALEALGTLCADRTTEVAAAAATAYKALSNVLTGIAPVRPVGAMQRFQEEYARLLPNTGRKTYDKKRKAELKRIEEIIPHMDEIVFSQLPLRHAFPHVYCKDCYAWAERCTYESWSWLRCTQCKETAGLVGGVERVVGQIGGVETWELQEGTLRVNLWDDGQRKARVADMNALEIVGGRSINYDWAVNAVLDKLAHRDQRSAPLSIHLQGATLEPNTIHLLRLVDGSLSLPA